VTVRSFLSSLIFTPAGTGIGCLPMRLMTHLYQT
jgi:hypothetical protein